MSKAGKLVKDLVKAKKESVMGKLANGDDPMEPWSKRFDAPIKEEALNEDTWLFRYIRSLGWDPTRMTFAGRSKYARSNAFKHWKQSHMERRPGETATMEEVVAEGSGPKEKQKTPYRDINSAEYRAAAEKQKQQMAKDKLAEPGKKLLAKKGVTEGKEDKINLDEAGTGLLMSYIKSKGLDPRMMDGNQKSAYSKSSEFRIFKNRHVKEVSGMGERGDDWNEEKKAVKEAVDAKDTVTMDIPLLIRVLEYAREDAKTDMDLHKVVENLINMRGEGSLSMDMYDKIVAIKEQYGPAATAAIQQKKAPYHVAAMDRKDKENQLNINRDSALARQKVSRGEDPTLTHAGNAALKAQQNKNIGEASYINGVKQDPESKVWKLTSLSHADAVAKHGKENVRHVDAVNRSGDKTGRKHVEVLSKLGEETEQIDELSKDTLTSYALKAGKSLGGKVADIGNAKQISKFYANKTSAKEVKKDAIHTAGKRMFGLGRAASRLAKEEVEQIDELKKQNDNMEIDDHITREEKKMKGADPCWKGYQMVGTKKKGGRTVPNCVPEETEITEGIYGIQDSPLSATNSVKAMESTGRKKEMTKSARMIKSIYKKKNVKETMYDWEKSEKGGKVVDEPTAKVIMKGGTTMTGKPRDTIEIEPVLRTKLNRPAGTNPSA